VTATGLTIWLTGLPAAGKSTIAQAARALLLRQGSDVALLDGDELRRTVSADLGFGAADRSEQGRRAAALAADRAAAGAVVLVAVIAPFAADRAAARATHAARGIAFAEVHVDTPVAECARRDPKGLYARAARGEIRGMTGVDAPYERPARPDLRIATAEVGIDAAAAAVAALARA
jgi:adenylylsulfate kinase